MNGLRMSLALVLVWRHVVGLLNRGASVVCTNERRCRRLQRTTIYEGWDVSNQERGGWQIEAGRGLF